MMISTVVSMSLYAVSHTQTQADATPDLIKNAVHTPEPDVPSNSKLQTIEVRTVAALLCNVTDCDY